MVIENGSAIRSTAMTPMPLRPSLLPPPPLPRLLRTLSPRRNFAPYDKHSCPRCHRRESEYTDSHAYGSFLERAKALRNPVPVQCIYHEDNFLDKRGRSVPRLPPNQDYSYARGASGERLRRRSISPCGSQRQNAGEASEEALNLKPAAETCVENAETLLDFFPAVSHEK